MNEEKISKNPENISETETKNLSSITNDEDLQEKISEVQKETNPVPKKDRFVELEKAIHDFLARQDSENALKIITK